MAQGVQFVVQRHQAGPAIHWDLMIEHGSALATWQLPVAPEDIGEMPVPVQRIADHQRRFLTYEGPLRSHPGCVSICDRGICVILSQSAAGWKVAFGGQRMAGTYRMEPRSGAESADWRMKRERTA